MSTDISAVAVFYISESDIHSETYSIMIDTFIKDKEEQTKLFEAVENFPCIVSFLRSLCPIYSKNPLFPTSRHFLLFLVCFYPANKEYQTIWNFYHRLFFSSS